LSEFVPFSADFRHGLVQNQVYIAWSWGNTILDVQNMCSRAWTCRG